MNKTTRREALGLLGVATGAAVMGTLFNGKRPPQKNVF
ncbi:twin-arginine translocation signal domain-containing protein [Geotalea uraniireducens]